jgi:hypothetical protein
MKKTLLLALALIAVGCAEPDPRNLGELVQQADECLEAPQEGYERCWDILVPDGLSGSVPLLGDQVCTDGEKGGLSLDETLGSIQTPNTLSTSSRDGLSAYGSG